MALFIFIVAAMVLTGLATFLFHMAPIWWGKLIDAMAKVKVKESD